MTSNLLRTSNDKMIAGVCGGLGQYLGIDPVLVRLLFVLGVAAGGLTPLAYVILWIVMPLDRPKQAKPVHYIADHPRPVEDWKYDPYTGQPVRK